MLASLALATLTQSIAHDCTQPPTAALTSGPDEAYWLATFRELARVCPLPIWRDVVQAVLDLHGGVADPVALAALEDDVRAALPIVRVRWSQGGLELVQAEPLALATKLERCVIVDVVNRDAADQTFEAWFESPGDPSPAIPIAGGPPTSARGLLARVREDDVDATSVRLYVQAVGTPVTSVDVPATVELSAVVTAQTADVAAGGLAARVYVEGSDGILRHGLSFQTLPTMTSKPILGTGGRYRLPFSYSRKGGQFAVRVPGGPTRFTMERGYEFERVGRLLDVPPGVTAKIKELDSQRFVDMRALGWLSGDTHVHWTKPNWYEDEDLELLATVQRAEDLAVVNNLQLRQFNATVPPPFGPDFIAPQHASMGPLASVSDGTYHVQMAEEYRNAPFYGHLNLLNLTDVVLPISTGNIMDVGPSGAPTVEALDWPTNASAIATALAQDPVTTPASKPLAIGSHAGYLPGSSFEFAPPAGYVADVVLGRMPAIDQLSPELYYPLLNVGLRTALTMGADHPARLVGEARTYVRVGADTTYGGWIAGIAAGRTFVTSGPLILLSVDGVEVGDEHFVAAGDPLDLRLEVHSRNPIGTIQVLSLDVAQPLFETTTNATSYVTNLALTADQSRWFVARCSADGETFRALDAPDVAHTSAVFVTVDGEAVFDPVWAAYLRDACDARGQYVYQQGHFETLAQAQAARDDFFAARDQLQAWIDQQP